MFKKNKVINPINNILLDLLNLRPIIETRIAKGKVRRGGGYLAKGKTSSHRSINFPHVSNDWIGLRVCLKKT
jgi:hypothetical protein